MNAAVAIKQMTVEEYFAMEDALTEKHEFIDGVVYAMAGADFPHNQITANALVSIGSFLRNSNCRIYGSDLKVAVKTKSAFVYPDLTIICSGAQFFKGKRGIVTNPSVIIEVLSPDTERYDRGKKFMLYRQIETVREYILISSLEVLAERFAREESGAWTLTEYRRREDEISIDSISYQTTLAEFYRDVVFEEDNEQL